MPSGRRFIPHAAREHEKGNMGTSRFVLYSLRHFLVRVVGRIASPTSNWRFVSIAVAMIALATPQTLGGDAGWWLERASNSELSLREREYAARQVMVLADSSASILVTALRDRDGGALKRQVAAGILG